MNLELGPYLIEVRLIELQSDDLVINPAIGCQWLHSQSTIQLIRFVKTRSIQSDKKEHLSSDFITVMHTITSLYPIIPQSL